MGLFYCSKVAELIFYACDPSLEGELGVLVFMIVFVGSFCGFSDAWTDSTSIEISRACAGGATELSMKEFLSALTQSCTTDGCHSMAATLSSYMSFSFFVGVVFL